MAKVELLCKNCARIEFNYKLLNDDSPLWSLGPWSRQSRCPFCKLVRRLFSEWQRADATSDANELQEKSKLLLRWVPNSRFGETEAASGSSWHDNRYVLRPEQRLTEQLQVLASCEEPRAPSSMSICLPLGSPLVRPGTRLAATSRRLGS